MAEPCNPDPDQARRDHALAYALAYFENVVGKPLIIQHDDSGKAREPASHTAVITVAMAFDHFIEYGCQQPEVPA